MRKGIILRIGILILLLFLMPFARAEPLATSYWGYVTVDSAQKPNAIVTVIDSSGKEVARATSTSNAMYQVTVPWDDSATQAVEGVVDGETLTFNVDGKTATSKTIDPKGTNIRLDLTITSSSSTSSSSTTATSIATASPTATTTSMATASPTATTTSMATPSTETVTPTATSIKATASPTASPEVTAVKTEKMETPTPAATKNTPGFGLVLALAGLMAVILRKRCY